MENLKIQVSSEAESKEAQELFLKYGATGKICLDQSIRYVCTFNGILTQYDFLPCVEFKQINLPELRAMTKPMKEYLDANRNYEIVLCAEKDKDEGFIEIPEGAEISIKFKYDPDEFGVIFYKNDGKSCFSQNDKSWQDDADWTMKDLLNENYCEDGIDLSHDILWQREQDEPFLTPECTLNDQYAEIEQVRQVEIHGTAKAEPDLNFGAAQASGGAKMRENNHYFINVSDVDEVDFYEIAKRYNVTDPAVQHILKKCLAIGNRGHKDLETDLKDILKTAKRALQINGFGE